MEFNSDFRDMLVALNDADVDYLGGGRLCRRGTWVPACNGVPPGRIDKLTMVFRTGF